MAFHLRFRNPEFYETKVMFHLYIDSLLDMIVIPTNILLIVVFVRGNFCSPSHVVLIAIALANIIQMLSTMVPSIYFYGLGFAEDLYLMHGVQCTICLKYVSPRFARHWRDF